MNISTILNIFSTFAAGGMCCIRCKQKCFVLAQKAVKEVTFVLLFQRERGWTSCLWRNDEGQEGVHWHEDQPLDHQLTRRVVLNLSLATDRLLTDGRWWLFTMDFRCLFLHKRESIFEQNQFTPLCPAMGDQWKRGSHKIRRAFDISRFALD